MTKKRPLYVHVGLHKTGTTSIQWALTKSRPQLRELGVCYPESGRLSVREVAHHELAWSFVSRPEMIPSFNGAVATFTESRRNEIWREVKSEIAAEGVRAAVVSSEEFDIFNREEILRFGEVFADWDVVPIIFLRSHLDLVESGYRTAVLYSDFTGGIRAYAAEQRTRLDFLELVRDWSLIAANGKASVFNYDSEAVRDNLLGSFFSAIDTDVTIVPSEGLQRQNESVPAFAIECVRFMRLKGCDSGEIARYVANISRFFASRDDASRYRCLPEDLCEALESNYEDLRRRFAADSTYSEVLLESKNGDHWRDKYPADDLVLALLAMARCLGPQ
ncbi:hypothetical protein [Lysobacter terrae]